MAESFEREMAGSGDRPQRGFSLRRFEILAALILLLMAVNLVTVTARKHYRGTRCSSVRQLPRHESVRHPASASHQRSRPAAPVHSTNEFRRRKSASAGHGDRMAYIIAFGGQSSKSGDRFGECVIDITLVSVLAFVFAKIVRHVDAGPGCLLLSR